jgi:putative Holliday junction resolvase
MSEALSRILAIDYGSVRIGLAVSDPMKIIATGLRTIPNNARSIDEILTVITEYGISEIIVGNPLLLSGKESKTSVDVNAFVRLLSDRTSIPIALIDERFTSVMAQKTMMSMGVKKKQRQNKARIDEIASAILLQGYLDSRSR